MKTKKRFSLVTTLFLIVVFFSTYFYAQNDPVKNQEQIQVKEQTQIPDKGTDSKPKPESRKPIC